MFDITEAGSIKGFKEQRDFLISPNGYVEIELPGLEKEDLNIRIMGNLLKVDVLNYRGFRKYAGNTYKIHIDEIYDLEKITATMENSILILYFPEKQKYTRDIEIK